MRKLAEQCLLGAACQNMKKIALLLARLLASLNLHFDRAYTSMRHFLWHDAFLCRSPVFKCHGAIRLTKNKTHQKMVGSSTT
jgi:hypothetical protein